MRQRLTNNVRRALAGAAGDEGVKQWCYDRIFEAQQEGET